MPELKKKKEGLLCCMQSDLKSLCLLDSSAMRGELPTAWQLVVEWLVYKLGCMTASTLFTWKKITKRDFWQRGE